MVTQSRNRRIIAGDHPGFGVGFPNILDALRLAAFGGPAPAIPKTSPGEEFPSKRGMPLHFAFDRRRPLAKQLAHEFLDGLHIVLHGFKMIFKTAP